jgi:pre-mRNA-splicing factor CWC22
MFLSHCLFVYKFKGSGDDEDDDEEGAKADEETKNQMIIDETETNLVALRRTIYLTIQSSLDFQECAHKLLKMNIKKTQEIELCQMILDSCAQQRTFERFFGLLAQRFCQLRKDFVEYFEKIFKEQYDTVHRLETVKLRNVSKFFSHLFYTDSISWGVLDCIHLNEDETTSSSRVFIKNLFLDLSENMGIHKLKERLTDVTLQEFFQGLFPRDNPRNTRFSINFFTSIGLGPLTDDLREHLKSMPKMVPVILDSIEKFDQVADTNMDKENDGAKVVHIKKEKIDEGYEKSLKMKNSDSKKKLKDQKNTKKTVKNAKKDEKSDRDHKKKRRHSSSSSSSSSGSSDSSSSNSSSSDDSSSNTSSSSSGSSSDNAKKKSKKKPAKEEKPSKRPETKQSKSDKHRSPSPPPRRRDTDAKSYSSSHRDKDRDERKKHRKN